MKKTNGENGITLIALVVTIVVLLILAGITITYVMADGGIFDSAKQAATQTINSQVLDYAGQIQATYMTQNAVKSATGIEPTSGPKVANLVDGTISLADVTLFFPSGYEPQETGLTLAGTSSTGTIAGTVTVKYSNKYYTVTFEAGVPTVTGVSDTAPSA